MEFLDKLKILKILLLDNFNFWKKEILPQDLDAYYCCAGTQYDECGCGGATLRDIYLPHPDAEEE